jgi:hypothetical protein
VHRIVMLTGDDTGAVFCLPIDGGPSRAAPA